MVLKRSRPKVDFGANGHERLRSTLRGLGYLSLLRDIKHEYINQAAQLVRKIVFQFFFECF